MLDVNKNNLTSTGYNRDSIAITWCHLQNSRKNRIHDSDMVLVSNSKTRTQGLKDSIVTYRGMFVKSDDSIS